MSKRKVQFVEGISKDEGEPSSNRFKDEHTVDSDEENEDIVSNRNDDGQATILTEDDIEGQEEDTIKSYDNIKITPFNLREEMEEGHFDAEGNYIADKDPEALQDEWLEGIDWSKVKENEEALKKADTEPEEAEQISGSKKLNILKSIISLLKPDENVLKALRRLGGQKTKVGRKKNAKKTMDVYEKEEDLSILKENKEKLLKLTEMADLLLQQGDFEIYDKTFEKLNHEVKQKEQQFEDADIEDALEEAFTSGHKEKTSQEKTVPDKIEATDMEVMWEYKWENKEGSEVYGPYRNSCMMSWREQGFFKDGVLCRKVGSDGNFYNSKRIDFDLYS